ncbi:MAG: hypothetical protein LBQ61_06660 [Spirochaetales bacterium]|jgi:hypothetical protein|nr:hypothetical protein [Spirochaetales bacterium]
MKRFRQLAVILVCAFVFISGVFADPAVFLELINDNAFPVQIQYFEGAQEGARQFINPEAVEILGRNRRVMETRFLPGREYTLVLFRGGTTEIGRFEKIFIPLTLPESMTIIWRVGEGFVSGEGLREIFYARQSAKGTIWSSGSPEEDHVLPDLEIRGTIEFKFEGRINFGLVVADLRDSRQRRIAQAQFQHRVEQDNSVITLSWPNRRLDISAGYEVLFSNLFDLQGKPLPPYAFQFTTSAEYGLEEAEDIAVELGESFLEVTWNPGLKSVQDVLEFFDPVRNEWRTAPDGSRPPLTNGRYRYVSYDWPEKFYTLRILSYDGAGSLLRGRSFYVLRPDLVSLRTTNEVFDFTLALNLNGVPAAIFSDIRLIKKQDGQDITLYHFTGNNLSVRDSDPAVPGRAEEYEIEFVPAERVYGAVPRLSLQVVRPADEDFYRAAYAGVMERLNQEEEQVSAFLQDSEPWTNSSLKDNYAFFTSLREQVGRANARFQNFTENLAGNLVGYHNSGEYVGRLAREAAYIDKTEAIRACYNDVNDKHIRLLFEAAKTESYLQDRNISETHAAITKIAADLRDDEAYKRVNGQRVNGRAGQLQQVVKEIQGRYRVYLFRVRNAYGWTFDFGASTLPVYSSSLTHGFDGFRLEVGLGRRFFLPLTYWRVNAGFSPSPYSGAPGVHTGQPGSEIWQAGFELGAYYYFTRRRGFMLYASGEAGVFPYLFLAGGPMQYYGELNGGLRLWNWFNVEYSQVFRGMDSSNPEHKLTFRVQITSSR